MPCANFSNTIAASCILLNTISSTFSVIIAITGTTLDLNHLLWSFSTSEGFATRTVSFTAVTFIFCMLGMNSEDHAPIPNTLASAKRPLYPDIPTNRSNTVNPNRNTPANSNSNPQANSPTVYPLRNYTLLEPDLRLRLVLDIDIQATESYPHPSFGNRAASNSTHIPNLNNTRGVRVSLVTKLRVAHTLKRR